MRIVIDLIGFEHGKTYGYEEYLFNLLRDFKKYRDKIHASEIIIACHEDQKNYIQPFLGDRMRMYTLKYGGIVSRLWRAEKLPKELGLASDDLMFYPGDYMPLGRKRTKTLMVVHDLLFMYDKFCAKNLYFRLFRLKQYLFEPQGIRRADKIIAISNFTKNDIIEKIHVDGNKIETVYNYFNFGKYDDGEKKAISDVDYPYILTVCAGVKHKNHQLMLEAFSKIAKDDDTIHFIIVGSINDAVQPYFESIENEIKGRIHFYRHISNADLSYLYSNAKMYVSASLFEGLGMPVVEAMWFGIPTVLSDTEIHREVSFNKALYFNPTSVDDLYQKEKGLLEGTIIPTIVEKGVIEERYSSENTSMKYIEAINSFFMD